jgi:Ca-activated chloride channel homolog
MDRNELDRFFEQLLAENEGTDDSASASTRAALASAVLRVSSAAAAGDCATTAKLAAYLDGALDPADADSFIAALLSESGEIYELEAAQSFLAKVSVEKPPVPPELVAAVMADCARETRKPADAARRKWNIPRWGQQWGWAGGAIAAVLLAVVISGELREKVVPFAPTQTEEAVLHLPPRIAVAPPVERVVPTLPKVAALPPQRAQPAPLAKAAPEPAQASPPNNNAVADAAAAPLPQAQVLASPPPPPVTTTISRSPPPPVTTTLAITPPPPPALPAPVGSAPPPPTAEQVIVTGSLIHGTAAVGVPLTGALNGPMVSFRQAPGLATPRANTERYPYAIPNAVKVTSREPVSTFSVDVDTASYSNVRRFLTRGQMPPADAVRVEEMINYFDYHYAVPRDRSAPFQPTIAVYPTPWNPDTQILHIGIKGFDLARSERPRANLVFLIDTSGSMGAPNRLALLKQSFGLLVDQLRAEDRVSIVVYAGSVGTVLEPTSGSEKEKIMDTINRLQARGSTAGGEGIRRAYELAEANFDREGVNRVLLATDGDFNVGITDPNALQDFVAGRRSTGIFLTVLGFGIGNYNDLMMQKLAQAGNGVAAYIDTINEAHKLFVDQIAGTLFTIAKDVKIQVEFNPARVAEYRLIGYETRLLNETDFNNDKVDAGDIGSGHAVTALYEITPVDSRARLVDPSRYGAVPSTRGASSEFGFVKIRYKLPDEDDSRLITRPVTNADVQRDFAKLPADLRFAAAVAGTGQLLRHDPYIKSFDFGRALQLAEDARGEDSFGYRAEFIALLNRAQALTSLQPPAGANERPASTPEAVYTAPNPPVALTSHVVTADDYPPASVRLQEQGRVQVQYTIGTDGAVSECAVTTSSGFPRLDEAACVLVKKWKFRPATVIGGRPVAISLPAEINYALNTSATAPNSQALNGERIEQLFKLGVVIPPVATTSHAVTANDYPPVSIRLQEQGKVQFNYTVGTDGGVSECSVTMTSGKPRLDEAACTMVKRRWKFKPATMQDGKPVTVSMPDEIIFNLK